MSPTSPSPLPRLFLIRHGETAWTRTGQHTSQTDLPLTPHGETQARHLAPLLPSHTFTTILTSPLLRARRTCELAGFKHATIDPDLTEWSYGDYEGRTSTDIHRDNPTWSLFKHGAPGGESPEQISARADRFIARVQALSGDTAAFGSGDIIRVIAARWLGLPSRDGALFVADTASIGILGYHHTIHESVVCLWNVTDRLLNPQS